jgi:hypothetical protein
MGKTATVRAPLDCISNSDSTTAAAPRMTANLPSKTLTSSIKSCVSGFVSYIFNRFLMFIPSCHTRLLSSLSYRLESSGSVAVD